MLDVSGNNKSNTQHFVMKKLLLFILLSPTLLIAQKLVPRFENDTLYTTSGYNFYKGQTLTFAVGTGKKGKFRSVKIKGRDNRITLTNTSIIIKKLSEFYISGIGNGFIRIVANKVSSKKEIEFNLAFDRAIEGFPGLPSELIVPDEFKNNKKVNTADEISKLYKLYQEGVITKEEFEAQKKKLLNQ